MKKLKTLSAEQLKPWHVAAAFFGIIIIAGIIFRIINS